MYEELFAKPNVNLVGYGYRYRGGERVGEGIVVGVKEKLPLSVLKLHEVVPRTAYGFKTDVLEVGEIVAPRKIPSQEVDRTGKLRPCPPGMSIGHYSITAGTFGSVVIDEVTGQRFILSNNHVLAASNAGNIGDVIVQPGTYDGGSVYEDAIGKLLRYVPIDFGQAPPTCPITKGLVSVLNGLAKVLGSSHKLYALQENIQAVNTVDAAVAIPDNDEDILDEILEIGTVQGTAEVGLGDKVQKSGRTTGYTTDFVMVVDATVQVSYGEAGTAQFEHQIVAGAMSAGGDSGSLGLTMTNMAFGLLFAGSDQVTIFNPIDSVLSGLNVRF